NTRRKEKQEKKRILSQNEVPINFFILLVCLHHNKLSFISNHLVRNSYQEDACWQTSKRRVNHDQERTGDEKRRQAEDAGRYRAGGGQIIDG
ncbi:MAG: hypothetical protein VB010_03035, partial [Sphaerochaeta associata]|uniref:hypothetical protein n=1 Tax=Sphaerochaeta associata TaxID=1129264 RepID=UPI002B21FB6A